MWLRASSSLADRVLAVVTPSARSILRLCVILSLQGCVHLQQPLPLAEVTLDRMYGGWYLIATIPNLFERGIVAPYDTYQKRPDGDIREDFYYKRGGFGSPQKHFVVHDWVRAGTRNAHWRVQPFWPINVPFLVLYVDSNYRYALFGENNKSLGWIYSRTQSIPDADYQSLLEQFATRGYDSSRFKKFVQTPEQLGMPGYWSDGIRE